MPTFDFRCGKCETVFEETIPFGSSAAPACPSCGAPKAEKLLSAPGVVFRGSGFYKTDSRAAPKEEKPAAPKKADPPAPAAPAAPPAAS